ncbi:hypothetical protein RI129_001878 [Pyrocoelia pectoralis]|uniref:NADPH:adrenodoxin oxidoreductase, mitochondrial n=1 Tax=Pyrocoelia pectoralis TaxID=417401 RepID=A0AAN7VWK7_9COLE
MTKFSSIIKRLFSTQPLKKKICIIGAGPAGFYAAQHLLKCSTPLEIDIYERLPVPFGLVRFGVAPDHPEVKNVINTFTKTAQNPNVRFIGNVSLGSDISLRQLEEAYNCILLTYGAEENRKLDIPGENLPNVIPARRIVGWYNGVFDDTALPIDLNCTSVAIIGQGNVAIDVARILLTPIDLLKTTDITQHSLEALSESKIKEVHLIGRRGPLQAACTIKELREMLKLPNCGTIWNHKDFRGISEIIPNLARPRKRITELMLKSLNDQLKSEGKVFKPAFFKSPIEVLGKSRVEKIVLGINELYGDNILDQSPRLTSINEHLNCDLVVTSIGYKSVQVDPGIPFDFKTGKVQNNGGKIKKGIYATGWLATGPTGVILTTMSNAFGTAEMICHDLEQEEFSSKEGFEAINKCLEKQNKRYVTWDGWKRIDVFEQEQGKKVGKPREKVLHLEKMLEIAL